MSSDVSMPEHWINLKRVSASGDALKLSAKGKELSQLAKLTNVEAVDKLDADLKVTQWGSNGISITGDINSRIEQICVATLDPMKVDVNASFTRHFIPEEGSRNFTPDIIDGEMILDPEEDDFPDIVEGDSLNLWEVLVEELNLEIDPYPRSIVQANEDQSSDESSGVEPTHRPFAGLDKLISVKKPGT